MAIPATTMSNDEEKNNKGGGGDEDDEHEHDMVMPGFRFHPTEEELVEFYLRRKVEGRRFNVELITFLDLYRYDPWELPALATIGEKEWYFYVPRDRKYRNGDRPNRVTTSGYWKATGADRMIRGENSRSIGLKKTLVFYSGKAPKGIRTSWIMNEYRLPHHETERYQKAEISLCRVYKRPGVEDYSNSNSHNLPRSLSTTRASSSSNSSSRDRDNNNRQKQTAVIDLPVINSKANAIMRSQPSLPPPHHHHIINPMDKVETDYHHHPGGSRSSSVALSLISGHQQVNPNYKSIDGDDYDNYDHRAAAIVAPTSVGARQQQAPPAADFTYQQLVPTPAAAFGSSSSSSSAAAAEISTTAVLQDDLQRLVNYHNQFSYTSHQLSALLMPQQLQPPPQLGVSSSSGASQDQLSASTAFSDRVLWDWNPASPSRDYNPHHPNNNPYK